MILDRIPHFDERSLNFNVAAVLPATVDRKPKVWAPPSQVLDQGNQGHCVGFGWSEELAASPVRINGVDNDFANAMFYKAQAEDRKMGNIWPDGASVLAGAKAVSCGGYLTEYRWATAIDDMIDTLVAHGPIVVGTNWLDGMFHPHPSGLLDVEGTVAGGHCWLIYGYHPKMRLPGEGFFKRYEVFRARQSWGPWGYRSRGDFFVKVEDYADILMKGADQCVPVHRTRPASV